MIGVDELLALILADIAPLPAATVDVADAVGCVLAEGLVAVDPLPHFANSAMDGFAVRRADLRNGCRFALVDDLAAGANPQRHIGEGEAASIATGAMLPDGADAVVPIEQATVNGDHVTLHGSIPNHGHVRPAGEDVSAGATVAAAGRVITNRLVAVAMATGIRVAIVIPLPRIGILTTGDELMAPDAPLRTGMIRDTNRLLLAAALDTEGFRTVDLGQCRDDAVEIADRIATASSVDAVVVSGGLGPGARDVVVEAMNRAGTVRAFDVAMRPGKAFAFGEVDGRRVYALPGNPGAALTAFHALVAPALRVLAGRPTFPTTFQAVLAQPIDNSGGRRHYVRATLAWDGPTLAATPTGRQGSGLVSDIVAADVLVVIHESIERAEPGDIVQILPLKPIGGA